MTALHSTRRRWARLGLVGAGGTFLAILAVVAFIALARGIAPGGTAVASLPCSPQPCLDVQDYTMWASNVKDANGIVRIDGAFRNSSAATHASPEDLQLVDASRRASPAIQDVAGCTHWSRTEFSNGARLGPLTICFRPQSTASPLTLRWTPDLGLICCEAELKIR